MDDFTISRVMQFRITGDEQKIYNIAMANAIKTIRSTFQVMQLKDKTFVVDPRMNSLLQEMIDNYTLLSNSIEA